MGKNVALQDTQKYIENIVKKYFLIGTHYSLKLPVIGFFEINVF